MGRRRTAFVAVAACAVAAVGASAGDSATKRSGGGGVRALVVIAMPTPPLAVRRYDTSGSIPQVRGGNVALHAANAALRSGVVADEQRYARAAGKSARLAGSSCRGVYETQIDRLLLSASTVVVSALLPATQLYPCGNEGHGWVAVTVQVASGRRIAISDLFAYPEQALPVLERAWKARFRHTEPRAWPCVANYPRDYRPTPDSYRYFALTPRGLAIGFWQAPACDRLEATVPYPLLRPYLGALGRELVAGVQAPK